MEPEFPCLFVYFFLFSGNLVEELPREEEDQEIPSLHYVGMLQWKDFDMSAHLQRQLSTHPHSVSECVVHTHTSSSTRTKSLWFIEFVIDVEIPIQFKIPKFPLWWRSANFRLFIPCKYWKLPHPPPSKGLGLVLLQRGGGGGGAAGARNKKCRPRGDFLNTLFDN